MADYGINIGVNVQASQLSRLTQQLKELRKIEQDLIELQQDGLITQKASTDLRRKAKKQIEDNKKAVFDAAKSFSEFTGIITKGSSALKEQSAQFKAYRQNVKFGRVEWTTFTQAITKTDFTATLQSLKRFNTEAQAIATTFKLMGMGGAGPSFGAGASIESLLTFKPANTTNALQAYSNVLEDVIRKVDRGSDQYRELAQRIREVNNEMNRAIVPTANQYGTPIGPQQAPSRFSQFFGTQTRQQRISGAISSGLIGGGFPLLFGQAGPGAIGGLAGGLAGGALGGGFGFGLSVLGTAIGEAIQKNIEFNESLGDLNGAFKKAGSDSKFLASDIDNLAKSLRITREEALQLAQSFAFLGDKTLAENAAKLFGTPQLLRSVARIEDAASLGNALRDLSAEIGEKEAMTLGNEIKGLTVRQQRLKIEERLNQARGKTVKLTNEELRATSGGRRVFRGAAKRPERFETAVPASALGVSESSAAFEQFLRGFEPQKTRTATKADPTIALQQRLQAVQGQIEAEQEILELEGRQTEVARMIYRENMAIVKAQADGVAERKKLKDANDIILSQEIEAGRIKVANLLFEREARELAEKTLEATKDLTRPIQEQIDQIRDKAAYEREYGELIRQGVVPAVAQQTVEINKQVKELERLTEKQLTEVDLRIETLQLLVDAAAGTELQAELQERLNKALERRNEIERKGREAADEAREAQKTDKDRLQDAIDLIQGEINNLMDPVQQVISLASTMGNAFGESFKGIISGSMTAREALANLFQRTADHFLDMAARMIAAQIQMQILNIGLSFLGGGGGAGAIPGSAPQMTPGAVVTPSGFQGQFAGFAANGGQIQGGKSYIVGEKGPELFTPGASGFVTPNHALGMGGGGSITVNVDAKGSTVEGNDKQANQLGKVIGAAVQQELIKQKKPGGLLA